MFAFEISEIWHKEVEDGEFCVIWADHAVSLDVFIYLFFKSNKLFQPSPGQYNHIVDEREYTVDQWKELIFHEVIQYELHQIKKYTNGDKQTNNQSIDQSIDQPME